MGLRLVQLPSETRPMSGGLPFPPSLLYYPVATPHPPSRPQLQKSLQNSASHLVQPQSSPLLPSMVRITLYSAARLPACGALPGRLGLAAHSLLQLPPKPEHRLHKAFARLRSRQHCPAPVLEEQGGHPAKGGWVWAAATMAAGGSFVLRSERARGR